MELEIRKEEEKDHNIVFNLIESAFSDDQISDHTEQLLVNRLRNSANFVPELSLVACANNTVVGHILLTKLILKNNDTTSTGLAMAPVSVLPGFQKIGIGSQLINKSHAIAKSMGFPFIVVIGHVDYYPRFGYHAMDIDFFKLPFEVPQKICFIQYLHEDSDIPNHGDLIYDSAFFE